MVTCHLSYEYIGAVLSCLYATGELVLSVLCNDEEAHIFGGSLRFFVEADNER